jgi:Galactose oxidase, central domain
MPAWAARAACAAFLVAVVGSACGAPGSSPDPTFGSAILGTAVPRSSPAASLAPTSSPGPSGAPTAPTVATSGSWTRLENPGPAPAAREDHTWTLDESGRIAYLFGGRDGAKVFDDLWAFDLDAGTWREIEVEGRRPAGRFGHEAAWTPIRDGLLLTFGQSGGTFYNDVWLFEPGTSSWRELRSAGSTPVPRYGSCSGIGSDGRLWISHGFTEEGTRFSDTRAYDLEAQEWIDETPAGGLPVERCLHVCWWSLEGTLTLYGGQTTGVAALGDLWSLVPARLEGPNNWFRLAKPEAGARQLPAVASRGLVTYIVGGRGIDREPLDDTWFVPEFTSGAFTRLRTQGSLPPRSGGAMVYDDIRDRMVLFGGIGDAAFDDLWALEFPLTAE